MSKRRLPLRAEKTGSAGGPNGGKRARRAGNKVDTAVDSGSDSSESDGEILLADARVEHDDMEVTFEFNDMKAAYAEGVTTLLRWFLPSHEAYELAAVICNQVEVGTIISCDGGDDAFAFATLLPISGTKNVGIVAKIVDDLKVVVDRAGSSTATAMREHLSLSDLNHTLLMLESRFSNLPLQLITPLFRNMEHDLEWVQSSDSGSAVSVSTVAQFSHVNTLLFICPCSLSGEASVPAGSCLDVLGSSIVMFDNFEAEVFFEEASAAIAYQSPLKSHLVAMLLPLSKLKNCIKTLQTMLPQDDSYAKNDNPGAGSACRKSIEPATRVTSEVHSCEWKDQDAAREDGCLSTEVVTRDQGQVHSFFELYLPREETTRGDCGMKYDIYRILIHHEVQTTIDSVGLQVWCGAFLLADYLIHKRHCIRNQVVLDLGCGTGILEIVLSLCGHAAGSFATDYREDIVKLAKRNIESNVHTAPCDQAAEACVLDWKSEFNPRDKVQVAPYGWTSESLQKIQSGSILCIASDVIYNDELTDSFFSKAASILRPGEHLWLSLEKRYNFSIEDVALVANGYSNFLRHVNADHCGGAGARSVATHGTSSAVVCDSLSSTAYYFKGSRIPIDFPQRFIEYNRIKELELWDIELASR